MFGSEINFGRKPTKLVTLLLELVTIVLDVCIKDSRKIGYHIANINKMVVAENSTTKKSVVKWDNYVYKLIYENTN